MEQQQDYVYQPSNYSQTGSYVSPTNYVHPDIVRFQLDSQDVIDEIEHFLNGDYFDNTKKMWIPNKYNPICTPRLRYMILNFLRTHLHKNMLLSNLEKAEINETMYIIQKELYIIFGLNHEEFYYPYTYMDMVILKIVNSIWGALKRAEGAGERNALKYIEKLTQTINEKEPQRTGMFSRMANKLSGQI